MNNKDKLHSKIINSGKKVLDLESKSLKVLSDGLSYSFSNAVITLMRRKGKIIICGIGKSGHIAKKVTSTLTSTGNAAIFLHPTEACHGDLGIIKKEDIIIIFSYSGKTKEIINLIKVLKKLKNKIISITQKGKNEISDKSNISINLPNVEEACPNKIAPTTSTSLMLGLGDALAVALMVEKNFSSEDFYTYHPGGNLGDKLKKIKSIMHIKNEIPIISQETLMTKAIIVMTKKGFGVVGITNKSNELIGIITDGDLRRNMKKLLELKAKDVMTKDPITIDENSFVLDALDKMNKLKITSIFCFSASQPKKITGIIHIHDCLRLNL